MPSTYSPDLRIELIANGEQSGTWGQTTNNNLGTLIEDAISGLATVSVSSANQALSASYGTADQARCAALRLTTTTLADFAVYAPPVTKIYIIQNASAYAATIYASTVLGNTTAAGAGVTIPAGKTMLVRCNGTDFVNGIDYIAGSFSVSGSATIDGNATLGTRLSGTYSQTATTVTVTTSSAHGYTNGEAVAFINSTGLGLSGTYTITVINTTSFSFTSAVSQATSGNCFVTNDLITLNGVVSAGVVIEGTNNSLPALRVTQTGTNNAIVVDDTTNPDTTPFVVNNSGNVGIGTQTPAQLLDITSDSTAITQLSRYSTDTSSAAALIRKSRGTLASPTIVASGDSAGVIAFQAYDGAAFQSLAQIAVSVDGTPAAGDMPGKLTISTTPDGSATLVDRIVVTNAGLVGVGVTPSGTAVVGDPSTLLSLKAGTAAIAPLGFASGTALTNPLAGAAEYDGTVLSFTNDTTSKRGYVNTSQIFRLTASGSALGPTIADYFGATSSLNIPAGGIYEIRFHCFFTKTTAGTVVWTVASSQTPVSISGTVSYGAVAGGTATGAANQIAIFNSASTAAAFGATASLTAGSNQAHVIRILYEGNASTAGTVKLQVTSSAGTVTPLRGSYYKVTRLPSGNSGSFA